MWLKTQVEISICAVNMCPHGDDDCGEMTVLEKNVGYWMHQLYNSPLHRSHSWLYLAVFC